ncbi:hypothetical protein JCM33374_g4739 [Metschnikowia sp. JCM 33374]|nr:hypothetical protein JCM33374_g4739 [Metschnikowia sp. JCM 33374]
MPNFDASSSLPRNVPNTGFGTPRDTSSDDDSDHDEQYNQHDHYHGDPAAHVDDPVQRYDVFVQLAFRENIERAAELRIDEDDHIQQIEDMVFSTALAHGYFEKNVVDLDDMEIVHGVKEIFEDLQESLVLKAFVAASAREVFSKYFPSLGRYFARFNRGSKTLCYILLQKYTCFMKSTNLCSAHSTDLGYVLGAFHSVFMQKRNSLWRPAGEDSRVINMLIRQWKGTSSTGLDLIMKLVREFEHKYRSVAHLYKHNLLDLIEGFPIEGQTEIQLWWEDTILENPQWDQMRVILDFKNYAFRFFKPSWFGRLRKDTTATEGEYTKFMKILKRENCENEFWKPHNIVGPDGRKRSPPKAAPDITTQRIGGINNMIISGQNYLLNYDSVLSPTKRLFVLNKQAKVTITSNKDHIGEIQPFTGLSVTDNTGQKHRSQGKGKVLVSGRKIVCYWVPTFSGNILSLHDVRSLSNHAILDKHIFVYNSERKIASPVGRIQDKKHFDAKFVNTRNREGPCSEAFRMHLVYAHPKEQGTRVLCERQNIPFGPSDLEAVRNCETCLTIQAENACNNGISPPLFPTTGSGL